MATVYGSKVSNVWRAYATATVSNTSNTICTVTCTAGINIPTKGYETHRSFRATAYMAGNSVSGSGTKADRLYKGVTTVAIATKSYQFTRTHSAYDVNFHGYLATPASGSVSYSSTTSYGTLSIPPRPSYTVSYNANGGSGAPASATKWCDETLTLSTVKPTRTGYTFLRWNTNSAGTGTNYNSGANYTANSGVTLYAVWQKNTWPVSYNANGGSGTIANQTKVYGESLTLSNGAAYTRALHTLESWNTASNGTGTRYALGGTYTNNAALTLYAQWHLDYVAPTLFDLNVYRVASQSSTEPQDDGEFIYGTVSYVNGYLDGYLESTVSVYIDDVLAFSTQTTDTGTVTQTVGTYSKDITHIVRVVIADDYGSATLSYEVPTAIYPIDLYGSGTDVYMGVMHPYVDEQELTLPDTYVDGDIVLMIDDNAATGTVDGDLYDALDTLGWI